MLVLVAHLTVDGSLLITIAFASEQFVSGEGQFRWRSGGERATDAAAAREDDGHDIYSERTLGGRRGQGWYTRRRRRA